MDFKPNLDQLHKQNLPVLCIRRKKNKLDGLKTLSGAAKMFCSADKMGIISWMLMEILLSTGAKIFIAFFSKLTQNQNLMIYIFIYFHFTYANTVLELLFLFSFSFLFRFNCFFSVKCGGQDHLADTVL